MTWLAEATYLAIVAMMLVDWRLTAKILATGRGREANPLVRWIMERIGVVPGLMLSRAVAAVVFFGLAQEWPAFLYAFVAIYAAVLYNNSRVLKNLTGEAI